jgi:hypothetical protein
MTRPVERPIRTKEAIGKCRDHDVYDHDAFGTITLSITQGGSTTLFGSDVGHGQKVRIRINRASMARNLSNDWVSVGDRIVDFSMSHSQFAQFITSSGNGSGTPITLEYAPPRGTQAVGMPHIANEETKNEMFRREITSTAEEIISDVKKAADALGAMIESGKISKTELRAIHRELNIRLSNLPGNMAFVVGQAEEALEVATTAAKIDVEAFIDNAARRIGLEAAKEIGLIANDTGANDE